VRRPWSALLILALAAGCGDSSTGVPVNVIVAVSPLAADLGPGATRRFTATVTVIPDDGSVSKDVRWEVVEGPAYGNVDAQGLYTAPEEDPPQLKATVRAVSVARSAAVGEAEVTLVGAGSRVDAGWAAFEAGNFDLARSRFLGALAAGEEDSVGARVGAAWSDLRLGDHAAARGGFEAVLADTAGVPDALGGLVLASAAGNDPVAVRNAASSLLGAAPNYVFAHDSGVSASDVRWFLARAALDLGDLDLAAAQLDILVPANALDPEAAGFVEAALALLESIQGEV